MIRKPTINVSGQHYMLKYGAEALRVSDSNGVLVEIPNYKLSKMLNTMNLPDIIKQELREKTTKSPRATPGTPP